MILINSIEEYIRSADVLTDVSWGINGMGDGRWEM